MSTLLHTVLQQQQQLLQQQQQQQLPPPPPSTSSVSTILHTVQQQQQQLWAPISPVHVTLLSSARGGLGGHALGGGGGVDTLLTVPCTLEVTGMCERTRRLLLTGAQLFFFVGQICFSFSAWARRICSWLGSTVPRAHYIPDKFLMPLTQAPFRNISPPLNPSSFIGLLPAPQMPRPPTHPGPLPQYLSAPLGAGAGISAPPAVAGNAPPPPPPAGVGVDKLPNTSFLQPAFSSSNGNFGGAIGGAIGTQQVCQVKSDTR